MLLLAGRDQVLESELGHALHAHQLFLVYQPLFDLRSERMTGAEALIRWRHPERGVLLPAAFLGAAEDSGLIVPIGRWVLETACARAARWHCDGHPLGIAVNLSAAQLRDPSLPADVAAALERSGLDARALTLELSERTLTAGGVRLGRRITELKRLGARVAIDDFGSGGCSLLYVSGLLVDAIKIDGSFVSRCIDGAEAAVQIRMLIKMGRLLGLQVLGEGIESEAQLAELRRLDLDAGQGFLLGRPVAAEWIDGLLASAARAADAHRTRPAAV